MIKLVKEGNLLTAKTEALVNTVNCVGVMGKGVALQFKQAFPDNFDVYARACKRGDVRPGRMLLVETNSRTKPWYIINFPTKRHWRGKSRLEDIEAGLVSLIAEVQDRGIRSIAVPPLGCGNGGLDWDDVRPRIEQAFAAVPDVDVLLFEPGNAPTPEEMPVRTKRPALTRARAGLLRLLGRYKEPGYRLTLLEVQKLAYFLQAAGEPMQLRYVKHLYGPYAESLNHVLQRLEGHYVRGYGDRSARAEIRPTPGAVDEASRFLGALPDTRAHLDRVAALIEGFETPYAMELLATVHWVAQGDMIARRDPEHAILLTHKWNARKRNLMPPEHIRVAWQRLRDQGWLDETNTFEVAQ